MQFNKIYLTLRKKKTFQEGLIYTYYCEIYWNSYGWNHIKINQQSRGDSYQWMNMRFSQKSPVQLPTWCILWILCSTCDLLIHHHHHHSIYQYKRTSMSQYLSISVCESRKFILLSILFVPQFDRRAMRSSVMIIVIHWK